MMIRRNAIPVLGLCWLAQACASSGASTTTVYTPGGQVTQRTETRNGQVVSDLHRVFDTAVLAGEGIFEHANEGLARQGALSLAQADLAQKVQTTVRGNTTIHNNQDIRTMVETSVNALVQGYGIDYAGYDPNSIKYRVRISITGERLVKEIETRLR
ncbi:MAG: hypothetical protein JNM38_11690 [Acidobacteria bacterium]|jgi:hypothetical protein|nr:hypothetical protein [Acidobacteriota bacterium]